MYNIIIILVTPYQPIISLNLKDDIRMRPRPDLNLSFGRLGLNLDIRNNTSYGDIIDATLPLERQGYVYFYYLLNLFKKIIFQMVSWGNNKS